MRNDRKRKAYRRRKTISFHGFLLRHGAGISGSLGIVLHLLVMFPQGEDYQEKGCQGHSPSFLVRFLLLT
jgi:hypothetical protein